MHALAIISFLEFAEFSESSAPFRKNNVGSVQMPAGDDPQLGGLLVLFIDSKDLCYF